MAQLRLGQKEGKENHKLLKHENLETELELYPFNIVVPDDPVIKNEAMFDYHVETNDEKMLLGARFFSDANTHYEDTRDMKDLIMYTEAYYGWKMLQLGLEVGSVTGEEYISVGPQFTTYDHLIFKRMSVVTRLYPDVVVGYEYTTQEGHISKNIMISSTGMGRLVFPSKQTVTQVSLWISFEKPSGVFIGVEYEYNNALGFNNYKYERPNELFFGVKFELK